MYIEMEMLSAMKNKKKEDTETLTHNVDKGSSETMQKMRMHTRTHACTLALTHIHMDLIRT